MALVERRYAEALVNSAQDSNTIEECKNGLTAFVKGYETQDEMKWFLVTPELSIEDKKALIDKLFINDNTALKSFLKLLIDKGRISNVPGILSEFVKLADERNKVIKMKVVSASELDEEQLNKIKLKYIKEYKAANAEVEFSVDPSIIGGIIVKIGDRLIDGSIAGRLDGLKEVMLGNAKK